MPKKKVTKKRARKAATKRKGAKKQSSAPKRTARKKSARKARPASRKPKLASVPYNVHPQICTIKPPTSQNFAPGEGVKFDCGADCDLIFGNPAVLGFGSRHMYAGMNGPFPTKVKKDKTDFWIKDCAAKTGPAEIIVP